MSFESYERIFIADKDVILKSGRSFSLDFELDAPERADRVFFTGETQIFYQWKSEPDYAYLYRRIDDSLTQAEAERAQFALDMSGKGEDYPRIAYKKIMWAPRFYGYPSRKWSFGISAKANSLTIGEGGYLHFLIEVRYRKEGIANNIAYTEPDVAASIDIPEGTYQMTEFSDKLDFDSTQTANIALYLEGENYSGNVFFELPHLDNEQGNNILADFGPFTEDKEYFNWLGVNLSKKETPSFKIELNGKEIFDGEIFERCHRYSEAEIPIPKGIAKKGTNTLKFTHTSSYRDAPPYGIHEIGIVSTPDTMLVSCPEIVTAGKPFHILLKTNEDDLMFSLDAPDYITLLSPYNLGMRGLKVITLVASKPNAGFDFNLIFKSENIHCHISRCVIRAWDSVVTGTGDLVYVGQNKTDFENYICWYLSNHIGNLLTMRPTYRWSGSKCANGALWRNTAELLTELDIKYSHMIDGRELPGGNANPRISELESECFLGRQSHELDGAYIYQWTLDKTGRQNEQMYYDLFMRMFIRDSERTNAREIPENYITQNGRTVIFKDLTVERDMEALASYFVGKLAETRYYATRHTGPATLFKYFYQAGYKWTGAELMYTSTEILCSFLRGASRCYGGEIGGHLATQWSTTPYNLEHTKRYRLALYISYMQGINEINTEEGLWHLEEYYSHYHRFSKECIAHLREQQDFFRYISTHARTGRFYTPVAFVSGRYDAVRLFANENRVFGRDEINACDAEESFKIIQKFYPTSAWGSLYRHPCPTNSPVGYYSGTPLGNVDVLPIECAEYDSRLLIAIGYNKAVPVDMDKLYSYVNNGGTLVIGIPQLSVTTKRADIESYNMTYIKHSFAERIAPNIVFAKDTVCGKTVHICKSIPPDAKILEYTDSMNPLIYSVKIGNGSVFVINTREYIASPGVRQAAESLIMKLSSDCFDAESVWAEGERDVQFAVYKQDDGATHIYLIATDWYNAECPNHNAKLRIGDRRYELSISYGKMLKAVVSNGIGAWFDDEENDVISIGDGRIFVQGYKCGRLYIARNGKLDCKLVDFSDASVKSIGIQG